MRKNSLLAFCLCILCFTSYAQDEKTTTLSAEQTKEIMKQLKVDTAVFLSSVSKDACMCIDSIGEAGKGHDEIVNEVNACIDKQVMMYQVLMKTNESMFGSAGNSISINVNKESRDYQRYYYDIERWLKDSCGELNRKIVINNKESEFSMTKNPAANLKYEAGIALLEEGDYAGAMPYFKKCVELDPQFAFAWDNLAVCYRRTERYDEAIAAYKKSLEIDPKGITPLHNLPVVYELKKDYKKAVKEYEKIVPLYPDDPEIFYGIGRLYTYFIVDYPKGLEYACKSYNLYVAQKSPYRADAEKVINYIYTKMKADNKEKEFNEILKKNNINPN